MSAKQPHGKSLKRRLVVRASSLGALIPKLLSKNGKSNSTLTSTTTNMGNIPIQKAVPRPLRPFSHYRRSLRGGRSASSTKKASILLQLIARRDWQKVLIRASLFPAEINQKQTLKWYGVDWNVLPLHLACALEPPAQVIRRLSSEETACTTMTKNRLSSKRFGFSFRKPKKVLQESNTARTEEASMGHYSASDSGDHLQQSSFASKENSGSIGSGSANKKSKSNSTMQWDLTPLLRDADCLLPIHLACLYRASSAVIQHLLGAYPEGAKVWAMGGMLPIHMLCAGFAIPPPIAAPADYMVLTSTSSCMVESLQHLVDANPECTQLASHNNGMTPFEYLEETMEDETMDKKLCLRAVRMKEEVKEEMELQARLMEDAASVRTDGEDFEEAIPSEIVCDEEPSEFGDYETLQSEDVKVLAQNPLYSYMLAQDWESAYDLVEDVPEKTHQWQYGIEIDRLDTNEPQLWKRLPIHNACRYGAPVALLSIILRHNPALPADPYTGALPMHYTCRYAPSIETVQVLLYADPTCVKQIDNSGRLPMHFACMSGAPAPVIQALIKGYPGSVAIKDKSGKTPVDYCSKRLIDGEMYKMMKKLQFFLQRVEERKEKDKEKIYKKPTTPLGLVVSTADTHVQERLQAQDPSGLMLDSDLSEDPADVDERDQVDVNSELSDDLTDPDDPIASNADMATDSVDVNETKVLDSEVSDVTEPADAEIPATEMPTACDGPTKMLDSVPELSDDASSGGSSELPAVAYEVPYADDGPAVTDNTVVSALVDDPDMSGAIGNSEIAENVEMPDNAIDAPVMPDATDNPVLPITSDDPEVPDAVPELSDDASSDDGPEEPRADSKL